MSNSVVKIRAGHRAMTTRLINELEALMTETALNIPAINGSLSELRRHYEKLCNLDEVILQDLDEDNIIIDMQDASVRSTAIQTCIYKVEECLKQVSLAEDASQCSLKHGNRQIKLPTLNLPKFNGDPLDWSHFWDIFSSTIHNRQDMADAQKFTYLMGQLQDEALELLDGFTTTDANYAEAVTLLQGTFGDPKRIIQSHLHALFDLKGPSDNSEDLSKFRASFECHIRGLKALGTNIEGAGFVIAALLLRKLPSKIRDNINRAANEHFWELDAFRTAINDEIRLLQAVEPQEKNNKTGSVSNSKGKPIERNGKFNKFTRKFSENHKGGTASIFNASAAEVMSSKNKVQMTVRCRLCFKPHLIYHCDKFKTPKEKSVKAKELGLCLRCLLNNHPTNECRSSAFCTNCEGKHNSALCFKKETNTTETQSTTANCIVNHIGVALPTGILKVERGKRFYDLRALFDQGSQKTFILEEVVHKLNFKPNKTITIALNGFNCVGKPQTYDVLTISVKTDIGLVDVECIVVKNLPSRLVTLGLTSKIQELKKLGLCLADPNISTDNLSISVLVGSDQYFKFVQGMTNINNTHILKSNIGDMIVGNIQVPSVPNQLIKTPIGCDEVALLHVGDNVEEETLDDQLSNLWSLDAIGIKSQDFSNDEKDAVTKFKSSLVYEDGRYTVRLPWKSNPPELPSNYGLAKGRLTGLLRKLREDEASLKCYHGIIQDHLQREFVEEVKPSSTIMEQSKLHYLAHHCVSKESITTPLRVVYDCSAGSPSLNDCLLSGPSYVNDLGHILLRLRLGQYACSADIEKAFLQVRLHEEDRDSTRFLWPRNPFDINSPLTTYRFRVVLFGATCSQYLLNAVIKHHLAQIGTPVAHKMLQSLYVDNLLTTFNYEQELIAFFHMANDIMCQAGLTLREWVSNSLSANGVFNAEGRGSTDVSPKILGISWLTQPDFLSYPARPIDSMADTKRKVLQNAARIYDPLGFLTPVTIRTRLILQTLWKEKWDWDQELTGDHISEWQTIACDLRQALTLNIFRSLGCIHDKFDVHVFGDASTRAYGVAAYAVNGTNSNLLIAKARVAPIKTLTVPQLELTAALLATRISKYLLSAFEPESNIQDMHLWTDSLVTWHWIHSNKKMKPYVQNRVDEIRQFERANWHYVPTAQNPSDLVTRGSKADILNSALWLHGPSWLCEPNSWPEIPKDATVHAMSIASEANEELLVPIHDYVFDLGKYSKLSRVLKVTALVKRFIHNIKGTNDKCRSRLLPILDHQLQPEELIEAQLYWIKQTQRTALPQVFKYFEVKGRNIKMPDIVRQLDLFMHDDILRCRRRLFNADIDFDAKNPIYLPPYQRFTDLLVEDIHQKCGHLSVSNLVVELRNRWWIPRMRQRVKGIVRRCTYCRYFTRKHCVVPPSPPLPSDRVLQAHPFTVTGIDYTGALLVKEGRRQIKAYIALFTCAITRAIHLELVSDNTLESFLLAFRRFTARRSIPDTIYSDNAAIFKSSAERLRTIHPFLKWKFIPVRAPWFGGFWERLIGLTKSTLKKILGTSYVNREELRTILTEVEMGLNDRPLTWSGEDLNDPDPLTPSALLYGHRLRDCTRMSNTLDSNILQDISYLTKKQKYLKTLLDQFWLRWKREYLTSLRNFYWKKESTGDALNIGDVMLIKDSSNQSTWKLGRIVKLFNAADGYIRSVELKTSNGTTIRPVARLYPLEISQTTAETIKELPRRKAFVKANKLILKQSDID